MDIIYQFCDDLWNISIDTTTITHHRLIITKPTHQWAFFMGYLTGILGIEMDMFTTFFWDKIGIDTIKMIPSGYLT